MNKLSKRLTAGAVGCAVAVSALPLNVFAEEEASERVKVIRDSFSYYGASDDVFYYTDDYFAGSGKDKNEHLRTMSLCLASAAMSDAEYSAKNAVELLTKIGFEDIETFDYDVTPTADTIGCVIAQKEYNDKVILAVAVRGGNYGDEVINLVDSGTEGDAFPRPLQRSLNASNSMKWITPCLTGRSG